ncbi:MAG: HepT-like ribonuclease domain-containing protein [Candidatus Delongbacteria bacterium]
MSDLSDKARLENVLEYIKDIHRIVERHGNIDKALDDFEGEYAILMCMQQIGEMLNKIENQEYIKVLPVQQAYGFRNILAHSYGSVNINTVKDTIEKSIPELKTIISSIL